ncbi:hypothetical protein AWB80_07549 [Caballeronia pedi]|uniref:Uncharacterized protein n=1 Tax=Caballeronia pedi TaxID=1777141 RepID=A0A158DVE1_9BURK|nr:hypothetical protein [Caballeronia pedi]SAK98548.1 hypothetical protein AWB80_07549 [Caballeronia pedi]
MKTIPSATPRMSHMFDAVRAMYVIGTSDELLELRERNEQRLAIARSQPRGQQVFRPALNA